MRVGSWLASTARDAWCKRDPQRMTMPQAKYGPLNEGGLAHIPRRGNDIERGHVHGNFDVNEAPLARVWLHFMALHRWSNFGGNFWAKRRLWRP
eukprot:scaffold605680_cov19-Prasinocladus_malaysianus.AAC.1